MKPGKNNEKIDCSIEKCVDYIPYDAVIISYVTNVCVMEEPVMWMILLELSLNLNWMFWTEEPQCHVKHFTA